jgi:hypothetical protein
MAMALSVVLVPSRAAAEESRAPAHAQTQMNNVGVFVAGCVTSAAGAGLLVGGLAWHANDEPTHELGDIDKQIGQIALIGLGAGGVVAGLVLLTVGVTPVPVAQETNNASKAPAFTPDLQVGLGGARLKWRF